MYYNPLKKKQIDVVMSCASSYSLLASLLLSLNLKIKIMTYKEMDLEDHMQFYLDQNLSKKEAMKKVAADRGVSKRDIYQQLLDR